MQAKKFKNFTDQDFSWKWNGVEYTFKAGQDMYLEEAQANHFAKHLVDREMNRMNNGKGHPTNDLTIRAGLEAQCFPSDEIVTPTQALDLNETKKRGRPKKVAETEFEDLQEKTN